MADTVNITRTCSNCRKEHTLTVTAAGYRDWDQGRGAYVQVAFPELDPGQRELLVSGICGPCFDEIMVPEPEDDGPGALILIAGDPADIETFARAAGYAGAERPGEDEPTPGVANPSSPGVPVSPGLLGAGPLSEIHSRVLAGKTLQGRDASRGHLSVSSVDWPRCATQLPSITSPLFRSEPLVCNRPATIIAAFTEAYLDACARHVCHNPGCPVNMMGTDPEIREQALASQIPVCGMHLAKLRDDEQRFLRDVGGLDQVFHLNVIGVESVIGTAAEVFDLRSLS